MRKLLDRVVVVSPHLDDAVFSCGCLLAAAHRPVVVTILAGVPDSASPLQEWDRRAGFGSGPEAVWARREEDLRGLYILGATAHWLDFLDGQYGVQYAPADLAYAVAEWLASNKGGTVVVPMGLFHSDHVLVSDACMLARQLVDRKGSARWRWLIYEEAIHRRHPGALQQRLEAWHTEGRFAAPALPGFTQFLGQKMQAASAYKSQTPLFDPASLADIGTPERYWKLDQAAADTSVSTTRHGTC